MKIHQENILAYYDESGKLYCRNCATEGWAEDEWSSLKSDQVLTEDDRKDDEHSFCDVCRSLI